MSTGPPISASGITSVARFCAARPPSPVSPGQDILGGLHRRRRLYDYLGPGVKPEPVSELG
ncbi:MAG: hypothetical protein WAL63_20290 [Solirubrobacteraceae bacterium]